MKRLLIPFLLVAGCATAPEGTWSRDGPWTEEDWYSDLSYCELLVGPPKSDNSIIRQTMKNAENRRRVENCLRGRGWYPTEITAEERPLL